jgi:N-acetylneuraminic acid mutarotase
MKKIIFFSLIFIGYFLNAQGIWTQKASLPGNARSGAVGFSIGNKGYIATGGSWGSCSSDLWEWDSGTNVWSQKASIPGGPRIYAIAFCIGNKGYIATGYDGNAHGDGLNDLWEWDQGTNTWTKKADFAGGDRMFATGFSIGTKGYIVTGSGTNVFWEWDQSTDTWTQKTNFPGSNRLDAISFSIGNKGYVGTGSALQDFWEWDQTTNIWTQKSNFGGLGRGAAVGFSSGTKGYIGTGSDLQDFWEWDQTNNVWTRMADFGGGIRDGAVGFSIGNKVYIGTGYDGSQTYYNDLWEFDPSGLTEVRESENILFLNVSPNPSSGIFSINFRNNRNTKICVHDILGNCLLNKEYQNEVRPTIDLTCQSKGIYFLEMMSEGERVVKKIILE